MFTDIPLNTNIQILLLTLLGPNNVKIAALNEPISQLEKTFNKTKIYNKKTTINITAARISLFDSKNSH